jgi:hypothetical protein
MGLTHDFSTRLREDFMSHFPKKRCAIAVLTLAVPLAFAQTNSPSAKPETKGASEATTLVEYKSSLTNFRPFVDQPIVSWREANDTVAKIGGWRAYAKESQQSEPAPSPAPSNGAKQ